MKVKGLLPLSIENHTSRAYFQAPGQFSKEYTKSPGGPKEELNHDMV